VFDTTISKSIRLEESPAHRETIFTFAASRAVLRVLQALREVSSDRRHDQRTGATGEVTAAMQAQSARS